MEKQSTTNKMEQNREIKFRIWSENAKSFLTNGITISLNGKVEEVSYGEIMGEERDCVIQQFTGLLDKNGKEIYEGDIISYISEIQEWNSRISCQGQIVWYDSFCWAFQYRDEDKNDVWFLNSDFDLNKTEIIGNIFENLESLENKE